MFNLINMIQAYLTCTILRPLMAIHGVTLAIHPEMFISNLKYMGLGMLCIIIVMGIIIGVVLLLNKITSARKKADDDNQ